MKNDIKEKVRKVYFASNFQNRPLLDIVAQRCVNTIVIRRTIDKKKYLVSFKVISSWLHERTDIDFNTIIQTDYEEIDESDVIIGFWPWGAGTVSELSYAIRRYNKSKNILLYVDPWMLDSTNKLNILKPSPEYYSLITPFALLMEELEGQGDCWFNYEDFLSSCDINGLAYYKNDKNVLAVGSSPLGLEHFLYECSDKNIKRNVRKNNTDELDIYADDIL